MRIRTVGICMKPDQPQHAGLVRGLVKWLETRGLSIALDEEAAVPVGASGAPRAEVAARADLLIVLGGDGTLLSVAREAGARRVPILGVNLGTLGFMAEISREEMFAALERVLDGSMQVQERMRLDVRALRGDEEVARYLALNDAVVANSNFARLVHLATRVDDMEVTEYHADGLIVCTPTGSTAYSLSAGGPILDPRLEALVLTPISPHTLTHRPVVLPPTSRIEVRALPRGGEMRLSVDGQAGIALRDADRVLVERAAAPVHLMVSPFRNHFAILREKLGWGTR